MPGAFSRNIATALLRMGVSTSFPQLLKPKIAEAIEELASRPPLLGVVHMPRDHCEALMRAAADEEAADLMPVFAAFDDHASAVRQQILAADPVALVLSKEPAWRCGESLAGYFGLLESASAKLLALLPSTVHKAAEEAMLNAVRKQLFPHRVQAVDNALKDILASTDPAHARACSATSTSELIRMAKDRLDVLSTCVAVDDRPLDATSTGLDRISRSLKRQGDNC